VYRSLSPAQRRVMNRWTIFNILAMALVAGGILGYTMLNSGTSRPQAVASTQSAGSQAN
jgi:hypothetical protein